MADSDEPESLASLDARLAKAQARRQTGAAGTGRPSGKPDGLVGLAFRMGTELVAAVGVALLIGWALDRWLGTRPWLTIVLFFLGASAGMVNVYRAVGGAAGPFGKRPG